jgi:hypothetical protein
VYAALLLFYVIFFCYSVTASLIISFGGGGERSVRLEPTPPWVSFIASFHFLVPVLGRAQRHLWGILNYNNRTREIKAAQSACSMVGNGGPSVKLAAFRDQGGLVVTLCTSI